MLKGTVNYSFKKKSRATTTKINFGNIFSKDQSMCKEWIFWSLGACLEHAVLYCTLGSSYGVNHTMQEIQTFPWNCTTLLQSSQKCCCWTHPCSTHTHQPRPWVRRVKGSPEFLAGEGRMLPLPDWGWGRPQQAHLTRHKGFRVKEFCHHHKNRVIPNQAGWVQKKQNVTNEDHPESPNENTIWISTFKKIWGKWHPCPSLPTPTPHCPQSGPDKIEIILKLTF